MGWWSLYKLQLWVEGSGFRVQGGTSEKKTLVLSRVLGGRCST